MNNLFLLASALLLVACQQSSVSKPGHELVSDKSEEVAEVIIKKIEIPMVPAAKMASKGLQFTHSTATERAQVHMPFDIDISFEGFSNSSFTVEFKATPGLELASAKRALINVSEKGLSNPHKITVIPQAEGIYFINVFKAGATDQKPSAIKIVVGDKDIRDYMQTVGEIVEAEDGSKIVSMKADEG